MRSSSGVVLAAAAVALALSGTSSAEGATLVAAGDIACEPGRPETRTTCRQRRTAAVVRQLTPDVVATLGDAQYEHGRYRDYMGSYHPTWGAFRSITRPVAGNHEYMASADRRSAPGHFGYFGAAAGHPRRGYYSYELDSWTIVALNTGALERTRRSARLRNDCYPVSCRAGSAQHRWLRLLLARLPRERCVLAYWHHPRYSSGRPGSYRELRDIYRTLYAFGAELALAGHAHGYERFARMDGDGRRRARGVRQFVVGTGGAESVQRPPRLLAGSLRFSGVGTFGVLGLSLTPGRYRFRFVSERGATLDHGGGRCHGRPAAPR